MEIFTATVLVLTDISSLVAIFTALYKFIRKWDRWTQDKDKHDRENYLSILRLTIMSQEMPLQERIKAGDEYIKLGGNGEVKCKYNELLKKLPKEK